MVDAYMLYDLFFADFERASLRSLGYLSTDVDQKSLDKRRPLEKINLKERKPKEHVGKGMCLHWHML